MCRQAARTAVARPIATLLTSSQETHQRVDRLCAAHGRDGLGERATFGADLYAVLGIAAVAHADGAESRVSNCTSGYCASPLALRDGKLVFSVELKTIHRASESNLEAA